MKFDALNFDCLESVLEYLELIDLLNVADSTKRLKKAAELVYARKYGDKGVWLRNIRISPDRLFFIKDASTMIIEDLKTALKLLRCVGREISKLVMIMLLPGVFSKVNIDKLSKRDQRLFTYINDYCAEYVKNIIIYPSVCYASTLMEHFDKPFPNVHNFEHIDYDFTEKVSLNRLFPKLNSLASCHTRNSSFFSINTNHFPYLERFGFLESSSEAMPENEMLQAFIRLNPQLKELQLRSLDFLYSHLNTDLLRNAVECLQNIESLELDIKPITFLTDSDNIIHIKSVKNFAINFHQIYELPECFGLINYDPNIWKITRKISKINRTYG
ncbi:uncharacterized protein LOC129577270 isoform X1 [Sitodiplosis mosellana]|uniref:uncharacterized protein LOC129577270 isoform X1 n=1 Tax=Sitodiplosis mosellana TaxID=263140 RepID=UPI002443D1A5|nr:uncharacterized protein LOC129577270 isoform X1 [Sitodiplosis mosellana]XP_055319989.1 uncharacterized protein LOC129577270 isoform X1 [Sitodiplosis mosellana]